MARKSSATFYKRGSSDSTYFRYYDEHGRQREKSAPTLTSAKQLRAKLQLEAKERKRNLRPSAKEDERRRLTVADLIERYWPEFEAKKSARTTCAYRDVWKRDLGRLLAPEVVTGDIEAWRREQQLRGMGNTTINHYCSWLKAVFNLGIRDHLLEANPLAKGRIKKLPQNDPRDRVLTFEEERQLLPELEPKDRAAFVISLYGGLRQGEILRLERSDVDLNKASAKLRDTKAGKTEKIHLNAATLEAITWVMSQHGHDLLFPNEEGTGAMSGSRLTDRIKAAAEKLGIQDVLFHTARHTFVTRLGEDCSDVEAVRTAARHSTITMTAAYMHTTPKATREAVDGLCERFQSRGGLFPAAPSAKGHLRALA